MRKLAAVRAGDALGAARERTSVASQLSSAANASWLVKTRISPCASSAPRLRVRPCPNSEAGISCTRAPRDRASSALPSREPESTTTISTSPLDHLAADRVEAADEIGTAVLDRDDDGDHAGVAATTNWYAKSGGRSLPTACATRSVVGVLATGSGTVKSSSTTR